MTFGVGNYLTVDTCCSVPRRGASRARLESPPHYSSRRTGSSDTDRISRHIAVHRKSVTMRIPVPARIEHRPSRREIQQRTAGGIGERAPAEGCGGDETEHPAKHLARHRPLDQRVGRDVLQSVAEAGHGLSHAARNDRPQSSSPAVNPAARSSRPAPSIVRAGEICSAPPASARVMIPALRQDSRRSQCGHTRQWNSSCLIGSATT